jgi:hypothetical protein
MAYLEAKLSCVGRTPPTLGPNIYQRCKIDLPHWKNIAGLCFVIKMQFDIPGIELRQYRIDASFNRRMVRAVTGDKLLDYGLKGVGRKKCVRYKHQDCRTKAAE